MRHPIAPIASTGPDKHILLALCQASESAHRINLGYVVAADVCWALLSSLGLSTDGGLALLYIIHAGPKGHTWHSHMSGQSSSISYPIK